MLRLILALIPLVLLYVLWLRPLLRQTPKFKELYDQEEAFFGALVLKLRGLKQKLIAFLVVAAGVVVEFYDYLAPLVTGVDTSSLTAQVPSWAWPLIAMAIAGVMNYCRALAERRGDL